MIRTGGSSIRGLMRKPACKPSINAATFPSAISLFPYRIPMTP